MENLEQESSVLITREENDGSMRIDHDALRGILLESDIGDKPVAIISIAGCTRTGKSFMLNFFIRYFREKGWENDSWFDKDTQLGGFDWKGGQARCTTGIRVLKEMFEVPLESGGKMMVILMDTQGLFDHQTPEIVNKTLLTLSTLASSVQIFNTSKLINTQDLQYLKTCVDFATATTKLTGHAGYLKLQRLMFLVRDFPEDHDVEDPASSYGLDNGKKYLERILDSEQGDGEQIRVRKRIKESFADIGCFPLPYPGKRAERKTFIGKNDELDEDFTSFAKIFVEEVANPENILPKSSNRQKLTAREILNMVTACDTIFAQNKFKATFLVEANEKAYYAAEYEDAIAQYDKELKTQMHVNEDMDRKSLEEHHRDAKKNALRRYDSTALMGAGEYKKIYRKHLKEQCEEHFEHTEESHRAKTREKKARLHEGALTAFGEYETLMERDNPDGLEDAELDVRHMQHYQKIREKYAKRADLELLRDEIAKYNQKLRENNQQRREELKKFSKEKRRQELLTLSDITLRSQCKKNWRELKYWRSQMEMDEAKEKIEDRIIKEYWTKALTPVENVYFRELENAMEKECSRARQSLEEREFWRPQSRRSQETRTGPRDEKRDPVLPGKKQYDEKVQDVIQEFYRVLDLEMEKHQHKNAAMPIEQWFKTTSWGHKRSFFSFCSDLLVTYYEWLQRVMDSEHKEAVRENDENWKLLVNAMENAVGNFILELESKLMQIMTDRHIKESDMKKYYEESKEHDKQNPPEVFVRSEPLRLHYMGIFNKRMDASLKKMSERNRINMEKRNVRESSVLSNKQKIFLNVWKRCKSAWSKSAWFRSLNRGLGLGLRGLASPDIPI